MSSESALWRTTRENLSPFGVLLRVENRVGEGTADVLYCLRRRPRNPLGSTGWLELKEIDRPKLKRTPIVIPSLTREQVNFAQNWYSAGGQAWLLLQMGDNYHLFLPSAMEAIFNREVLAFQAEQFALLSWSARSPWPLAKILDQLTRT